MPKVTDKLIQAYLEPSIPDDGGERIKINEVVAKAALVYEKIRNAVDYQEEHLIRKNAIYRILKRKLVYEKAIMENYLLEKYHHENMTEHLLQELIRGGYLKIGIPRKMIDIVDAIIEKYNVILNKSRESEGRISKSTFKSILQMAAVEIEASLIPHKKEKALINLMFSMVKPKFQIFSEMTEKENDLQIYLACHRTLFKWDEPMLQYMLMTLYYPGWKTGDPVVVSEIANTLNKLIEKINKQINSPWQKKLVKIMQKKAIIYMVLNDLVEANGAKSSAVFGDPVLLEAETKKSIIRRSANVKVKLRRGVVRSIIYVFFTKMLLALAVEFPMDWYLAGEVNYFSAGINILFPPFIMFVVAIMIRMPKKENTAKIIEEIKNIASGAGEGKPIKVLSPISGRKLVKGFFHLIYFASFLFSLSIIFWFLHGLGFNVFSGLIFVLFLTLVSFFGIRIRRPVQELMAVDKKDNFIGALVDFFALPFVSMGRWMSTKFSKVNVIAMFLDLIIEAPFKLLVEVIEDLLGFFKEKKEDVLIE
ncbi:MAG: hypothetical protein WCT18_02740 [Patescibacteria group bacterium]